MSAGGSKAKSLGEDEEELCAMMGAVSGISSGVFQEPEKMSSGVLMTGGVEGMMKKAAQSSTSVAVDDEVVGRISGEPKGMRWWEDVKVEMGSMRVATIRGSGRRDSDGFEYG